MVCKAFYCLLTLVLFTIHLPHINYGYCKVLPNNHGGEKGDEGLCVISYISTRCPCQPSIPHGTCTQV